MKIVARPLPAIIAFMIAACNAQCGTFSDNFSTGLNPTYWSILQSTSNFYTVNVSQSLVHLAKGSIANPGGLQTVFIRLDLAELGGVISNDFTTQITFTNAVIPGPGLDQVELHTYYEDGTIFFDSYDDSSGINAHVWDGSSSQGITPVSGSSGTFTISRTGTTVSGYFNGTLLYSETRSSPLTAIEFSLQNNEGSEDATAVNFEDFSLSAASVSISPIQSGQFFFLGLTNVANFTWAAPDTVPGEPTATRLPGAPVGLVTLDGIPFNIASNPAGKQAWHADIAAGGSTGEVSITENVDLYGVTNVYSLINTWEGHTNVYAWFVFTGSAGTVYTNNLAGGVDIRDYNGAYWENDINGTTTVNVFDCLDDNWELPGRLDMQKIALPPAFATQTLQTIELVDNGGPGIQRVVLDGLTLETPSRPMLAITANVNQITVSWAAASGGLLQTNSDLAGGNWVNYGGQINTIGGTNSATLSAQQHDLFFRLAP